MPQDHFHAVENLRIRVWKAHALKDGFSVTLWEKQKHFQYLRFSIYLLKTSLTSSLLVACQGTEH